MAEAVEAAGERCGRNADRRETSTGIPATRCTRVDVEAEHIGAAQLARIGDALQRVGASRFVTCHAKAADYVIGDTVQVQRRRGGEVELAVVAGIDGYIVGDCA